MFTGITKTIEDRHPNEFIVVNNLWYLGNKLFTPGAAISDLNVNELPDMFIEYLEKNHKHT